MSEDWWKQKPNELLNHGSHHFWVMGDGNRVMSYGNNKSKQLLNGNDIFYGILCVWFGLQFSFPCYLSIYLKKKTKQNKTRQNKKKKKNHSMLSFGLRFTLVKRGTMWGWRITQDWNRDRFNLNAVIKLINYNLSQKVKLPRKN